MSESISAFVGGFFSADSPISQPKPIIRSEFSEHNEQNIRSELSEHKEQNKHSEHGEPARVQPECFGAGRVLPGLDRQPEPLPDFCAETGGLVFQRESNLDRLRALLDEDYPLAGGARRYAQPPQEQTSVLFEGQTQCIDRGYIGSRHSFDNVIHPQPKRSLGRSAGTAEGSVARPRPQAFQAAIALLLAVVSITSPFWVASDVCAPALKRLAVLAAVLQAPGQIVSMGDLLTSGSDSSGRVVITPTDTPTTATTAAPTTSAQELSGERKPIKEVQLNTAKISSGNVYVKNGTQYDIDIDGVLKQKPDCKIKLNAGYQVLIVHTHTTECYAQDNSGSYDVAYSPRTTDKSASVVAVGDVITEKLEAAGIRTLHITTVHDYPKYNGSYDRTAETIAQYLEQYPSIEMVIDVHRDAMTQQDGTKLKPTVEIDGKKAAQVMIITGCDAGGKLDFPEWRLNLRMAVALQKRLADSCPGLMRPLYFAPYRYNMHFTHNSLLIEFGTDSNTLEEALRSAGLVGEQLAQQLLEYVV